MWFVWTGRIFLAGEGLGSVEDLGVLFVFCLCCGEIPFILKLSRNTKIVLGI